MTRQTRRRSDFETALYEVNREFTRGDAKTAGYTLPRKARRRIARNRAKIRRAATTDRMAREA